jgi:orotidine-5'-phosphate decarboxylase
MATRSNPVYCAVDTVDLPHAARLIRSVAGGTRPAVGGIKLGLEFFLAHGAPGVRYAFPAPVRATGVGFFLDLKLHDIPNTVGGGIRAVVELEPTFITIHTAGGSAMMRAAAESAAQEAKRQGVARPKLLGVTVLTSLDKSDLAATGVAGDPAEQARRLALLAREAGLDGVICSPLEVEALRAACGRDFVLMVPGIRPAGASAGDQKRVMTPRQAVGLGANHLVIGRPITEAADPAAAAQAIAQELEAL